jgi:hypothetical protein
MGNLTAKIERGLTFHNEESKNDTMLSTFNVILQKITTSPSREQLESDMKILFNNAITQRYFNYGFGSNHMWLKQRSLNTPTNPEVRVNTEDRILIVEF